MTPRQMIDWFRRDVIFTFSECHAGIAKEFGCNGFLTTSQNLTPNVIERLKEFCATNPRLIEGQIVRIRR